MVLAKLITPDDDPNVLQHACGEVTKRARLGGGEFHETKGSVRAVEQCADVSGGRTSAVTRPGEPRVTHPGVAPGGDEPGWGVGAGGRGYRVRRRRSDADAHRVDGRDREDVSSAVGETGDSAVRRGAGVRTWTGVTVRDRCCDVRCADGAAGDRAPTVVL